MKRTRPLAVSTGDPGGVGPSVTATALGTLPDTDCAVVFGDGPHLQRRLTAAGLASRIRCVAAAPPASDPLVPGEIRIVPVATWSAQALRHESTVDGGRAQLAALRAATDWALAGHARAVVTAPVSKAAVNLGTAEPFVGHTEYLAARAQLPQDGVTMMFLGPRLRVGLATTHLAIARAPVEVTGRRVLRAIQHMGEALGRLASPDGEPPRLWVCGLNPHAGEGGLFGDEEIRVIAPAVAQAAEHSPFVDGRVELRGPVGAETAFRMGADNARDGVVAMVHDQATIASKLLDWGQAVNVTWGLPFVRTSVDHGVAYDAAAADTAAADGMIAALAMARRLADD